MAPDDPRFNIEPGTERVVCSAGTIEQRVTVASVSASANSVIRQSGVTSRTIGSDRDQGLREQLPDQAAPARADRETHGNLTPARHAAREQQVRRAGAGDDEQEAHEGKEDAERLAELPADAGKPLSPRFEGSL